MIHIRPLGSYRIEKAWGITPEVGPCYGFALCWLGETLHSDHSVDCRSVHFGRAAVSFQNLIWAKVTAGILLNPSIEWTCNMNMGEEEGDCF